MYISTPIIKSYSKKELAAMYQVSRDTLLAWFKRAGISSGNHRILTPAQVREVFERLGPPEMPDK